MSSSAEIFASQGFVAHLRIARPVTDPARAAEMYCRGLGFDVLGRFSEHDGFDGVMVGHRSAGYHLEFVRHHAHAVQPAPTVEDLLVLYVPDEGEWRQRCDALVGAGFRVVEPFNPYWADRGRTFVDADGYRLVVERAEWPPRR